MATGPESRSVEAGGKKIIADAEVSVGAKPNIVRSGPYTFFAGSRSDAFFFDFDGIKNLFDMRQTELHRTSSWRQVAMDRRGFEHRGERGFDRDRAADE